MEVKTSKEIWNHHSSYQRVYFAEEIKQRISFFLSDKLFGKNLDIGGGRYLYHPNSTVVDISPIALDYNPAKEKVEFDMDSTVNGNKLPFPDHSFDHATMVSVMQYIQHREAVIKELMRVLKPGAELYILDCGGCVPECLASHQTSVEEFFKQKGFSTFKEHIPFRSDTKEFSSLCVAMPDIDLFGPTQGSIRNRKEREIQHKEILKYKPFFLSIHNGNQEDEEETTSEDLFTQAYIQRETRKMNDLFYKIARYPVTAYSREYRKKIEAFTQACLEQTDVIPIITSNTYNEIEIDMLTQKDNIHISLHILGKEGRASNKSKEQVMEIAKSFGIKAGQYIGYFDGETPDEIVRFYEDRRQEIKHDHRTGEERPVKLSESEEYRLISCLAEVPVNSTTKALQEKLYPIAKLRYPDIDNRIFVEKARGYYGILSAHKQRKKGERLLEIKKLCSQEEIDTIEWKTIDYLPVIQYFPDFMEDYDQRVFRGHRIISDD